MQLNTRKWDGERSVQPPGKGVTKFILFSLTDSEKDPKVHCGIEERWPDSPGLTHEQSGLLRGNQPSRGENRLPLALKSDIPIHRHFPLGQRNRSRTVLTIRAFYTCWHFIAVGSKSWEGMSFWRWDVRLATPNTRPYHEVFIDPALSL